MRPAYVFGLLYMLSATLGAVAIWPLVLPDCCITPDWGTYSLYWQNDLFNLRRTPGYPALVKLAQFAPNPLTTLLWGQMLVFALTAPMIYWFIRAMTGWDLAAVVGGISFAVVEMDRQFIHQFLTEAVFVPISFLAFALMCVGLRRGQSGYIWAAVLTSGVATLIRPNFALFVLLIPALAWLLSSQTKRHVIAAAMAVLLCFPLSLAIANYAKNGVFSPSSIAVETAAYYWGARTLNIVEHPTDTYGLLAYGIRLKMVEEAESREPIKAVYDYYVDRTTEIITAHPWPAAMAFYRSLVDNLPRPFGHGALKYAGVSQSLYANFPVNGIFLVLVAWGAYRLFREHDRGLAISLVLYVLFFWGQTGISYWQDGRLVFPLDPFLFVLFACVFAPKNAAGDSGKVNEAPITKVCRMIQQRLLGIF